MVLHLWAVPAAALVMGGVGFGFPAEPISLAAKLLSLGLLLVTIIVWRMALATVARQRRLQYWRPTRVPADRFH